MNDDQAWLDALGGRAAASDLDALEAGLLRGAYRRWGRSAPPRPLQRGDEAALLERARVSGLLRPAPRAARLALAWRWPLLGLSVCAALAGAWWLRPATESQPSPQLHPALRSDGGLQLLRDAEPQACRERIAALLEREGQTVLRYERLGRYGLEAQLDAAASQRLQTPLLEQGLRPDGSGLLRVECLAPRP